MMHFGETLRKIRKNRCLTQQEVCKGIMKQATYSRIENGQLQIDAETFVLVADRLNVSLNEFMYIHQGYSSTQRQQLFIHFTQMELALPSIVQANLSEVKSYLNRQADADVELLSLCYQVLQILSTSHDLQHVHALCEKIWHRMQKLEHWYLNDLEILIVTIVYFPYDIAQEITKTALNRLHKYENFDKDVTHLHIYFLINLTIIHIHESRFEEALQIVTLLLRDYRKHLTYAMLALVLSRQIICFHALNYPYSKPLEQLKMLEQLYEDDIVFSALEEAIQQFGISIKR